MSGTIKVPMTVSYGRPALLLTPMYVLFDKKIWDAMSYAERQAAMDRSVETVAGEVSYDIDAAEEV